MRTNMKGQHTEMKRQLQVRHMEIANHVGEDIADAQNALGSAIISAQNMLGQDIVSAQNALGELVVTAQNANGKAIVDAQNYITAQHNKLSQWFRESLCSLAASDNDVVCDSFIGPLEENQSFIPLRFYRPEGHPTIIDRLEQIQGAIFIGTTDGDSNDQAIDSQSFPKAKIKTEEVGSIDSLVGEIGLLSEDVGAKMEMQTKLDDTQAVATTVQEEINDVKAVVKLVQEEMKDVKAVVKTIQEETKDVKDVGKTVQREMKGVKAVVETVQKEMKD